MHGETNAMGRLKSALLSKYHEKDEVIHIYTPRNTETVKLYFRGEKLARVSTFKVMTSYSERNLC